MIGGTPCSTKLLSANLNGRGWPVVPPSVKVKTNRHSTPDSLLLSPRLASVPFGETSMKTKTNHFARLLDLQAYCWRTGKKRWAIALGQALREYRIDNPDVRDW